MLLLERHRHRQTGRGMSCYSAQRAVIKTERRGCGWRHRKRESPWFKTELSLFCVLTDTWTWRTSISCEAAYISATSDQWYKPEVKKKTKNTQTFMLDDPLLGFDATDEEQPERLNQAVLVEKWRLLRQPFRILSLCRLSTQSRLTVQFWSQQRWMWFSPRLCPVWLFAAFL